MGRSVPTAAKKVGPPDWGGENMEGGGAGDRGILLS